MMAIVWAGFMIFIGLLFASAELSNIAKAIRNININVRMGTVKVMVEESEDQ